METPQQKLRDRTKKFALDVMALTERLPHKPAGWVVGKQMLRSATSVAANYRAAGRARSKSEFSAKLGVVLEEIDETVFWLEMIADGGLLQSEELQLVSQEANELLRIFSASCQTAKANARSV